MLLIWTVGRALGASEKILFSQLARPKELAATAAMVTNYSFCLSRSQTFLISYQRSSATYSSTVFFEALLSLPPPPSHHNPDAVRCTTTFRFTHTRANVHSRFLLRLVGNLLRFFRPSPTSVASAAAAAAVVAGRGRAPA